MSDDLTRLSALEQAGLVRSGAVSSEELVGAHLARIARLNPELMAFVSVSPRALSVARAKDQERRRNGGEKLPPFHGVPIGVKDLNTVRGMPTAWGSLAVPPLVAPLDDLSVMPLRAAGFVILGKLATSEFGAMPVTEPDNHPPTRNPWDTARTPGGSSGGSGAAVAAYLLPVAQASDGAGSIRIPAAFCNLFGLKPSRGRLPNQFGLRDPNILYTSGPIARTVEDAAALLDVLATPPRWLHAFRRRPQEARRSFLSLARDEPRRLRIRYVTRSPIGPTDPEIVSATTRAARLLASLGHEVSEGALPDATLEEFLPIWQRQLGELAFLRFRWGRTQPVTRWLGLAGRALRPADVAVLREGLVARFRPLLEEADVWVTPTVPTLPPRVGAFRDLPPQQAFAEAAPLGAFTALANLTGNPAASVPMGLSASGLPMGLQLIGQHDAEGDLLSLARQLERAAPWRHLTPKPPFG